ncbi:MAG: right-handed parallel beta-helix repeat-containing protein [bacterium]|nr:right-handed parallel beta-helix repeat-containing protein [bacterium]
MKINYLLTVFFILILAAFPAVAESGVDIIVDSSDGANATVGFVIKDKSLTIKGISAGDTILETGAGYGIYVENCPDIKILNLTTKGGTRDQDGSATDAAIVVRGSSVEVAYCEIKDNQGDYEIPVAGIGGVMGREGAILNIHHNKIHDNSWDGIALYRGAVANIHDNEIWNGRGAGVGITWDAHANIIRNEIYGYWKGIGSFGNSRVGVYNNFVHDLAGWGIIASGTSDMICRNNTVTRIGNVGIAGWDETARIEIVNNIISGNGIQDQWVAPRVGIWMNCLPGNFVIGYNCFDDNHDADLAFGYVESEDGTWSFDSVGDLAEYEGNVIASPGFIGEGFMISPDSLCVDSGDPEVLDPDGSRSDIGVTGGNYAG